MTDKELLREELKQEAYNERMEELKESQYEKRMYEDDGYAYEQLIDMIAPCKAELILFKEACDKYNMPILDIINEL